MSGVPLETCWAFKKLRNNKFYYKAASCWYFYWDTNLFRFLRMEQLILRTAVQSLVTIPTLLSGLKLYICFLVCFHGLSGETFTLSRLK